MMCLMLTITPGPATEERGLVLFLLAPEKGRPFWHKMAGGGTDTYTWQRYEGKGGAGRRFIDRQSAHKVLRRAIRSGEARGARLYRSGNLIEQYTRDASTGREVRLHGREVDETRGS